MIERGAFNRVPSSSFYVNLLTFETLTSYQQHPMRTLVLLFAFLVISLSGFSQVVTSVPALPTDNQSITITFDASKGTGGLKDYTGDIYAHIGVITDKSSTSADWKYVVAGWGVNIDKAKMIRISGNIYQLTLAPDIRQYFAVPAGEVIQKVALVFRSGVTVGGSYLEGKDTGGKDLYVDVYSSTAGLNFVIQQPLKNGVYQPYANIAFSANASAKAVLELYLNNKIVISLKDTVKIGYNFNLAAGDYWIKGKAVTPAKTVSDSVYVHVLGAETKETRPAGVKKGINYPDSQSAVLVLWAPNKQSAYVVGDFNDWHPSAASRMKRDGDYFWLRIDNLTSGKEYAFQYLVDGATKIADPYTDKILDPWNDQYINAATYPNLKAFPVGQTDGIVSVLQPGKAKYSWQVTQFTPPAADTCIIYEALVRDFDTRHSFAGMASHLDYLKDLKVNVLELMPVNEFEGNSSWGYNPSFYFAADKYYGPSDELKKLIDQCHQRGIAVVMDMVLNHSYGQSPFVQLYFDGTNPTAQNPWYNVKSNFTNTAAQWGFDFNHDSPNTRELVDSIASYWMSEYKVDGFRYDFTRVFRTISKTTPTHGAASTMPSASTTWNGWPGRYGKENRVPWSYLNTSPTTTKRRNWLNRERESCFGATVPITASRQPWVSPTTAPLILPGRAILPGPGIFLPRSGTWRAMMKNGWSTNVSRQETLPAVTPPKTVRLPTKEWP